MNDKIKKELETYTKSQLIELLENLCKLTEGEQKLGLLVLPSLKLIQREASSFECWCRSYERNPESNRAVNQLYNISYAVFACIDRTEPRAGAKILYEMYRATELDFDYCDSDVLFDIRWEIKSHLTDIINQNQQLFTDGDLSVYEYILED